jgi:tRNA pseudouridine55 synthase
VDGYLLVNKPEGISSFGVVAVIRRTITTALGRKVKVGHTGTLDPAATGLLILVIGKYTKKAEQFSKLDKVYDAELTLGVTSDTADKEGQLTQKSTHRPSAEEVSAVVSTFVGEILQTPPAYSAIKVKGQRAYKLARAGQEVTIEARKATIYSLENINYEYPKVSFKTHVSSGTYIRTLAEDIGKALGSGAYLSGLRRVSVGKFNLTDAINLDNLSLDLLIRNLKS